MLWIDILIGGVAGGIAGGLASLIIGTRKERRVAYLITIAVLFAGLETVGKVYVQPRLVAWEAGRETKDIPLIKELSVSDPATYQRLLTIVQEGARNGDSQAKISQQIQDVLMAVLPNYLGKAPDDNVAAFISYFVDQIGALDRANPEACYAWLYPKNAPDPTIAQKYMDKAAQDKALQLVTDLIGGAIKNPQPEPDPVKTQALLNPILLSLGQKWGDDLKLIGTPAADAPQRKKVCEIALDMYTQIATLPKADQSATLRYLLAVKK